MRRSMRAAIFGGPFNPSTPGVGGIVSHGPGIVLGDSTTARNPTVTSFLRNPAQNLITDLAVPGEKTNGQLGRFDALSSSVKAAAKWIIVMTGLNDRTDFPDGPTEVANYQAAIDHLRAACPTAKIIIARMNPAFSFYDALLGSEGPAAVAKYKAQWLALNSAIANTITGADFRVLRHTAPLTDPSYANSLHPLLAENPGDLHQNSFGSRIIAQAWQEALDAVVVGDGGTVTPPATTAPNNPTSLVGVASSLSIAYTWTAPAVDGSHSAATSYQLQLSADAGATWANKGSPTTSTSATATGLTASTAYSARVQAINVAGPSAGYSNVDARSTTAVGATALSRLAAKGYGVNQPGSNYFQGTYPYRNWIRQSVPSWDSNSGTLDTDGWLKNLPNGGTATKRVVFGAGYIPAGNYCVRTESGAHCTIQDVGGKITNVVQGTVANPVCTFTIPAYAVGDPNMPQVYLVLTVVNGTGATIAAIRDVYFGLVSNFAGHSFSASATGAQIFDPTFISDLAGCGAMKYADWQLMNQQDHDHTVKPGDLPIESHCSWATGSFVSSDVDANWNGNGVPHGVVAKLCKAAGMAVWPCFPPVYNLFALTSSASSDQLAAVQDYNSVYYYGPIVWQTGQKVVSVDGGPPGPIAGRTVYYVIRVDQWTIKLATSLANAQAGTAIDITGDGVFFVLRGIYDPGPVYDAIVDQMFAAAPDVDVIPQFALEPWNAAFYWNQTKTIVSFYPFTTGEIGENNASNSLGWRMCRIWQSMERKFSRAQYVRLIENQGSAFDYSVPDTYDYIDSLGRAGTPGAVLSDLIDVSSSAYYPHLKTNPSTGIGSYSGDGNFMDRLRDMIALGANAWTPAQWSSYFRNGIDRYYFWQRRDRAVLDVRTRRHVPMITYEGGLGEATQRGVDGGYINCTIDVAGSRLVFDNTGGPGGNQQYEGYPITLHGTGALPTGIAYDTQYFCHNPTSTGCQLKATSTGSTTLPFSGTNAATGVFFDPAGQAVKDMAVAHFNYTQSSECGADYAYMLNGMKDAGFVHYTHYTWHQSINFFRNGLGQYALKNSQFYADTPALTAIKAFHYTAPAAPSPTWLDNFNRAWSTAASSGLFTWTVEAGSPATVTNKLGGGSFRIRSTWTGSVDMAVRMAIDFATVGGTYPEIRIGGTDANNHFGVLFANTQGVIFQRKAGVYSAIGTYRGGPPDNTTQANCELSIRTSRGGGIDIEWKIGGVIWSYAYGLDPATCPARGKQFALAMESTIKVDDFAVYDAPALAG